MTETLPHNAVLLDVQKGFDSFNETLHRNNPALEANIARLQRAWRSTDRPSEVGRLVRISPSRA